MLTVADTPTDDSSDPPGLDRVPSFTRTLSSRVADALSITTLEAREMLDERAEQSTDPFGDTSMSLSPGSPYSLDLDNDNVKVMARCRPMSDRERERQLPVCVKFRDGANHAISHIGETRDFQNEVDHTHQVPGSPILFTAGTREGHYIPL